MEQTRSTATILVSVDELNILLLIAKCTPENTIDGSYPLELEELCKIKLITHTQFATTTVIKPLLA